MCYHDDKYHMLYVMSDITVKKPFGYRDGDVISGRGKVRHHNNSDYVECTDVKLHSFEQWLKE